MNAQTQFTAVDFNGSDVAHKFETQINVARLASYAQNLAQLPQYVEASWWGKLGAQKEAMLQQLYAAQSPDNLLQPMPIRAHSLSLQCAKVLLAKVQKRELGALPKLSAFTGVKGKIGALPFKEALRFLRMRALAFRRSAIRRCIDRASRERLYKWLESSVVDQLMKLPGTPQLDLLERLFDMPMLNQLSAEALEWEGLCLLERDGLWEATGPFAHLRLRFAVARAPLPWIKGTVGHDGHIVQHFDPEGGSAVLELLTLIAPLRTSSVFLSNEFVADA